MEESVENNEITREVLNNGNVIYRNKNRELHREDGPAEINSDGDQFWYKNGRIHREDGPAVIGKNGGQCWYRNGELHRTDGPAIILSNGEIGWWLDGSNYLFKEWCELVNISDEEKMELALKYG